MWAEGVVTYIARYFTTLTEKADLSFGGGSHLVGVPSKAFANNVTLRIFYAKLHALLLVESSTNRRSEFSLVTVWSRALTSTA